MKTSIRKPIIITFIGYIAVKQLIAYLGYLGDNSTATLNELLQFFSQQQIDAGIEYSRRGFLLHICQSLFSSALLLWLAFSGIAQKVESRIANFTGQRNFLTAFLLIVILLSFLQLVMLPFSYYFGHHLEHSFGFSNLTLGGWLWLQLKSFLLSIAMVPAIGALLLWLIEKFTRSWVFIATGTFLFIQLATSYLQPYVIIPIFFDPQPLEVGALRNQIDSLAKKGEVKIDKIFIVDASRYSKHTNAFFTGWGNEKRIYLFDTLLKKNTNAEVVSILGHELGHSKLYHVPMGIALSTASFFLTLLLMRFAFNLLKKDETIPLLRFTSVSSLPVYALLLGISSLVTTPLVTGLSRYNEGQADEYALEITGNVEAYISTEKKLAIDNKSRLNPHAFYVWFYYSHPPTIRRIQRGVDYKNRKNSKE